MVPNALFLVTYMVSTTFAYLEFVLHAQYAMCRYIFIVGFQSNFRQLDDVNSKWLAICSYSGVAGLTTGTSNLIWLQ